MSTGLENISIPTTLIWKKKKKKKVQNQRSGISFCFVLNMSAKHNEDTRMSARVQHKQCPIFWKEPVVPRGHTGKINNQFQALETSSVSRFGFSQPHREQSWSIKH